MTDQDYLARRFPKVTLKEAIAAAEQRYGPMLDVTGQCPACGTVIAGHSLREWEACKLAVPRESANS